mgnify:CR=1 FL=1
MGASVSVDAANFTDLRGKYDALVASGASDVEVMRAMQAELKAAPGRTERGSLGGLPPGSLALDRKLGMLPDFRPGLSPLDGAAYA